MQLIKSIAEVTKPPLRAELSMQSSCFSFVTELFILLHSAFTEGVWIPLPCTAAGSWLLTDAGMGRLVNKGIPRAFHFHDPVAQLFSSSFLDELGLSTKEGLSHQPPHTWHCLLTCFVTEPEKNILAELTVVLHSRESFSSLFGESEAGESVPSVPQALFTRNILQRCQEKPQTILENRTETSLRIHQWGEWDSRAWFAPFWRSDKLTPWIMWCCEVGYTCPRVFSFSKTSVSFTSAVVSFPITYFLLKWHSYSPSNNSPEGILQLFNIWGLNVNCPGPSKEFTPMRHRNDQKRFTVILCKRRESQPLGKLSQISIIVSLVAISNVITFPTITCTNLGV